MSIIRAQVTFQHPSELPEDRFVNTLHFRQVVDEPIEDTVDDSLHAAIQQLYFSAAAPSAAAISSLLATSQIQSGAVHYYNLSDDKPRQPVTRALTLSGLGTGMPMPQEVAIVASLKTPLNAPRGRGRFYVGPLAQSAVTQGTAFHGGIGISPTHRSIITNACKRLAETPALANYRWGVWSPTDGVLRDVVAGFVDDAFDTQRRRGTKPVNRTVWTKVIPE